MADRGFVEEGRFVSSGKAAAAESSGSFDSPGGFLAGGENDGGRRRDLFRLKISRTKGEREQIGEWSRTGVGSGFGLFWDVEGCCRACRALLVV